MIVKLSGSIVGSKFNLEPTGKFNLEPTVMFGTNISPYMNHQKIVRKIIKENIYLSLATSDGKACWIAPLYYVVHKDLTFYFVSDKSSLHAKQIRKNPYVAVSIFDSREVPEKVNGVQMDGLASEVGLKELPKAVKLIYTRKESDLLKERFKNYLDPKSYIHLSKFRIYKIKPLHFYILDPSITKEDKRIEVRLR